jgi:hypothetical protein
MIAVAEIMDAINRRVHTETERVLKIGVPLLPFLRSKRKQIKTVSSDDEESGITNLCDCTDSRGGYSRYGFALRYPCP